MKKNTVGFEKLTVFFVLCCRDAKFCVSMAGTVFYSGMNTPKVIMNMPLCDDKCPGYLFRVLRKPSS